MKPKGDSILCTVKEVKLDGKSVEARGGLDQGAKLFRQNENTL